LEWLEHNKPKIYSSVGRQYCPTSAEKELDFVRRLQSRIVVNGRKPERVTPRAEDRHML
jgi:hypothetical protein